MWGSLSYVKASDGFLMSVIGFVGYKQKGQWSVSDKGPEPNMAWSIILYLLTLMWALLPATKAAFPSGVGTERPLKDSNKLVKT